MRRFGALFFACHFNGTFNLPRSHDARSLVVVWDIWMMDSYQTFTEQLTPVLDMAIQVVLFTNQAHTNMQDYMLTQIMYQDLMHQDVHQHTPVVIILLFQDD